MPIYVARVFYTEQELKEYTEFFTKIADNQLERSIKQGEEQIKFQIKWRAEELDNLIQYLK